MSGRVSRALAWWGRLRSRTQDRLVGAVLAVPSGAVLALARGLTPAPAGVGTHMQLGLGGCTVLTLTGIPCPMCGMTTTFSHMAHFQPLEGMVNQPFGVALFCATLALFSVGLGDLLVPRGRWRSLVAFVLRHEVWVAGGMLSGLGLGWAYKVLMMGV